jgi:hypothetical protein
MNKIWATLFFLIFPIVLFANKIDSLKTVADVEKFIRSQDTNFKKIQIPSLKMIYRDSLKLNLAETIGVKTWQKIDFDNNGITDLLFFGQFNEKGECILFAAIDEGDKIKFHSFDNKYYSLLYPTIRGDNYQLFLTLFKGYKSSKDTILIKDTTILIYKFGAFVDFNNKPKTYKIEKIELKAFGCEGICPIFNLRIKANQKATFKAIKYNAIHGNYKCKVDSIHYSIIIDLLNYADFSNLKNEYGSRYTDGPDCILKITYNNGQIKTIRNNDWNGPYSLCSVIWKLFELRKNQSWNHRLF